MTREELKEDLLPIARQIFADENLEIADTLSASNVDGWTSLAFMQFLTAIEEKYGFKFKIMELLNLSDMGAVMDATLKHCE